MVGLKIGFPGSSGPRSVVSATVPKGSQQPASVAGKLYGRLSVANLTRQVSKALAFCRLLTTAPIRAEIVGAAREYLGPAIVARNRLS